MDRDLELINWIVEWEYHNEKLRQINKYLYEHTELFESKYMYEYKEELYSFFAGKITRFTRDYNELLQRLGPELTKKFQLEKIRRR